METLKLNAQNKSKSLELKSEHSQLTIKNITVNTKSEVDLEELTSLLELKYKLSGSMDGRIESSPINIQLDPYQKQAIFEIDKKIEKEGFSDLKIELVRGNDIIDNVVVEIEDL